MFTGLWYSNQGSGASDFHFTVQTHYSLIPDPITLRAVVGSCPIIAFEQLDQGSGAFYGAHQRRSTLSKETS